MIGYKYAKLCRPDGTPCRDKDGRRYRYVLIKLNVTGSVIMSHHSHKPGEYSGKMRTDRAEVLEMHVLDTFRRNENYSDKGYKIVRKANKNDCARSFRDINFKYETGSIVVPENGLDLDINEDCGSGIHFFPSKMQCIHSILSR